MDLSPGTKLAEAKQFLMENPTESKAVAAKIFKVNVKTLTASIRRGSGVGKHGGQNKILKKHEEESIDAFIRSLLTYRIQPTTDLVFDAIVCLKRAHGCPAPSNRWFRGWWKNSNLHKIRTTSLPMERVEAASNHM
jgi:hypothetical protein